MRVEEQQKDAVGQTIDIDSVVYFRPETLWQKEKSPWKEITLDTTICLEHQNIYWKGIPLNKEHLNIGIVSGALFYTFIFLVLLAWIRLRNNGIMVSLYLFFLKQKGVHQTHSEIVRPSYSLLFLLLCMSFSTLAVFCSCLLHGYLVFSVVLLFLLFLLSYHFVLIGFVKLLGWTFDAIPCAKEIIVNFWTCNLILGFTLSPFVIALLFVRGVGRSEILYVIALLFIIYLVFRIMRLFKILFQYRVSIFYMILYLCTLEIVPFLVVYKIFFEA